MEDVETTDRILHPRYSTEVTQKNHSDPACELVFPALSAISQPRLGLLKPFSHNLDSETLFLEAFTHLLFNIQSVLRRQ